jgi:hypothetical protein
MCTNLGVALKEINLGGNMTKGFVVFAAVFILSALSSTVFADTSFYGIGCVLTQKHNNTQVVSVLSGSPAEKAGIHSGEYITAVDGASTVKMPLDKVVGLIRGPASSLITVTVGDLKGHVRDVTMNRIAITVPDCFMEGNVFLSVSPVGVTGYIGNTNVNWFANGGLVSGYYKGEYMHLTLFRNGIQNIIEGSIHGSYVRWMGTSVVSTYQECIP